MPLDGIRGHRELAQRLISELKARPSHAYLLSGARGVGKALIAAALAHSLLCERSPDASFCCSPNDCPVRRGAESAVGRGRTQAAATPRCECCAACVQVAAGVHPDFTRIGRAANRTDVLIEQVREMIAQLGTRPSRGERRVVIIDDAETLNIPAQNALLKTLEEPPGHAIIFMITSSERTMLDTVRSRMRLVRVPTLSVDEIEAILESRGAVEKSRGGAIARLARGSASRALALADGDEPPMKELLDALARAGTLEVAGAQALAQEYFGARETAADNFELIARLLEEILNCKLLGAKFAGAAPDAEKTMAQLAKTASSAALVACLEAAVRARVAIDEMANSRLQAEQWWLTASEAFRNEA